LVSVFVYNLQNNNYMYIEAQISALNWL